MCHDGIDNLCVMIVMIIIIDIYIDISIVGVIIIIIIVSIASGTAKRQSHHSQVSSQVPHCNCNIWYLLSLPSFMVFPN